MYEVRLIQAVKIDYPYALVGDIGARLYLTSEAAAYAVQQGFAVDCGEIPGLPQVNAEPVVEDFSQQPVATMQTMNFDQRVSPELPDEPVTHVKEQAPERDPAPGEPRLKKPDGRTSQKGWAAWAVANDPDMTIERAQGMSKQDLQAQYGQRY